jgi:PASTA domain
MSRRSVVLSPRTNADGEGHLREIRTHRVHRRLEGVEPPVESRFKPVESSSQRVDPGSKARFDPVHPGFHPVEPPLEPSTHLVDPSIEPRLRPDEPRLQPVDPPVECVEATPREPCQKGSDNCDDRRVDRRSQEIHQPRILPGEAHHQDLSTLARGSDGVVAGPASESTAILHAMLVPARPTRRGLYLRAVLDVLALGALVYLVKSPLVWLLMAINVALYFVGAAIARRMGQRLFRPLLVAWLLAFPVVVVLLSFGDVSTDQWGGLMLNVIVVVPVISLSFPLGILLALGRRSSLPAISWFCVGFIELLSAASRGDSSSGDTAGVPNVVGMDLQSAQDTLQANGFYNLGSHDVTGEASFQILDRNWEVVDQTPSAGTMTDMSVRVELGVVRK